MKLDPAGYPFVIGALVPTLALAAYRPLAAIPFALLAAGMVFFFRDPERTGTLPPGGVVSPADGRVVVAGEPQPGAAPPGAWKQISIFLSPVDVHVNRMPVGGVVTRVEYQPGKCLPAYKGDAAICNERNEVWIDAQGTAIVCRQITGVLVRRVVCRVKPGDVVAAGQRFGVMKFGSRIDLFLPRTAQVDVVPGDRVRAGESIIARLS